MIGESKMIRYYCDGSYKAEWNMVGCGIVRREKDEIEKFFHCSKESSWFKNQEVFAIYQALLLIEIKQEKEVTIYNDDSSIMKAMRFRKNENYKIPNRLFRKIKSIVKKMIELEEDGYVIHFKRKGDKNSRFMRIAHNYSRTYLSNEEVKNNIPKEKLTILEYLASIGMPYQQNITEMEFVKHALVEIDESQIINKKTLLKSKEISFKRISKKTWCILNENEQPIYTNQDVTKMIYEVIKELLFHKQNVRINKSSRFIFETAMQSKYSQTNYPKIYEEMKKWEKENRIQFVS